MEKFVAVSHNERQLYLHGICLECLSMRPIHVLCRTCKTKFNFDPIIFGTLYYYGMIRFDSETIAFDLHVYI